MIFDIDCFLFIWYLHDLFIHGFCFSLLLKVPEQKYYVAIITKKKAICHMQFILLFFEQLWSSLPCALNILIMFQTYSYNGYIDSALSTLSIS